jgi:hypothetical protein
MIVGYYCLKRGPKLWHTTAPYGDRRTRQSEVAAALVTVPDAEDDPVVPATTLVAQTTRPSASDKTRLEVLVSANVDHAETCRGKESLESRSSMLIMSS